MQADNLMYQEGMLQYSPLQNDDGAAFLHQTFNKLNPGTPTWRLPDWASMPLSEARADQIFVMLPIRGHLDPSVFDLGLKHRCVLADNNSHLFYQSCGFDVDNASLPVPAWPMRDWAQEWAVMEVTAKALQALVDANVKDAH